MNVEKKKILIVEDDFNFGNILKDYLILNDYFVVFFNELAHTKILN